MLVTELISSFLKHCYSCMHVYFVILLSVLIS